MIIQLLVNVEVPNSKICGGLNGELHESLKLLAVDCLKRGLNKSRLWKIKPDVIALPNGCNVSVSPETVFGLIRNQRLLTKADVTRHFGVSTRTLERWMVSGNFPQPIYVQIRNATGKGPRWRPEDIAAFEHHDNGHGHARHD